MHMKDDSRILIAGTGALACLFAVRLSAAGIQVSMLGTWQEALDVLSEQGASLVGQDGEKRRFPVEVITTTDMKSKFDCILVLVKSWQTSPTAQRIKPFLAPQGRVLTLQNGLGNVEALSAVLGTETVFAGVTTAGATLLAPGVVRPGGKADTSGRMREIISVQPIPELRKLTRIFKQAGFEVDIVQELQSLIWSKLVISSALNPLTALLEVPNGHLLENLSAKTIVDETARESAEVARSLDITLNYDDPQAASAGVAQRTATNLSSMYQDILRGAPTEIDAINGAIVRYGAENGVPTPTNKLLSSLIRAKVHSRRRQVMKS